MSSELDPVDRALASLRSQSRTPATPNPELEEFLMQEFNHQTSSRSSRRPLLAGLAVLLIAGAGFAAAGGVQKLRSWLVSVNVDGQDVRIVVPEDGSGSMVFETEDGGRATIEVAHSSADGDTTHVKVRRQSDGFEEEDVAEVVRERRMSSEPPEEYDSEVLGDAEVLHEWQTPQGLTNAMYFIETEDGETTNIFLSTTDEAGEQTILLLSAVPTAQVSFSEPEISVDDDGTVTIKNDDGEGRVEVMKFRLLQATVSAELDDPEDIEFETPDGEIRVRVTEHDTDGE